jgi:hypothetical protein
VSRAALMMGIDGQAVPGLRKTERSVPTDRQREDGNEITSGAAPRGHERQAHQTAQSETA